MGNVLGRGKLKFKVSRLRIDVLGFLICSLIFFCFLFVFLKLELEEKLFGDCLFGVMKICNNFLILSGLVLLFSRFFSYLFFSISLIYFKGR